MSVINTVIVILVLIIQIAIGVKMEWEVVRASNMVNAICLLTLAKATAIYFLHRVVVHATIERVVVGVMGNKLVWIPKPEIAMICGFIPVNPNHLDQQRVDLMEELLLGACFWL